MFRDNLLVNFIKLNEIGPSELEIPEELSSLIPSTHELHAPFTGLNSLFNELNAYIPALQRIVFVLLSDRHDYYRLVDPIKENAPYQLLLRLIKEYAPFAH